MNKHVRTVLSILFFGLLVFYGTYSFFIHGDERKINHYIEKKYQKSIDVVHMAKKDTGNMGNVRHTVVLRENPNIQFKVYMKGFLSSEVVGDEYELGVKAYKEYKKINPYIVEIQSLGFKKAKKQNMVEYDVDYEGDFKKNIIHTLYLETSFPIHVESFEEKKAIDSSQF